MLSRLNTPHSRATSVGGLHLVCLNVFQVSPTEARSRRHILSMDCKPILAEGQPYVLINVVGASFMIHQIRKMVRCLMLPALWRHLPIRPSACFGEVDGLHGGQRQQCLR